MKQKIQEFILFLGAPFTFLFLLWVKYARRVAAAGTISEKIFMKLGVLPVLDQYYEPLINPKKYLTKSLRDNRDLSGIDLNVKEQLNLLSKFTYNEELCKFPVNKDKENHYYYNNPWYGSGDAEYLYNIIRHFKPAKIIEIGSGYSTLMARNAIANNKLENPAYFCNHICIEPYEMPWLEQIKVELIRKKVESLDKDIFQKLEFNDILFIDSSHVIRPQGDVIFEFLEILPTLKSGVLVHIHDILTPKDYLDEWVYEHYLWNEQYLLEGFLTFNSEFKIIGALNYLAHNYREQLAEKCPFFASGQGHESNKSEPRAFWIIRK